ncbi:MAG: hypothetical protein LBH57_02125 [Treponema sp.]|nr:hypothetical protein [Treponema sp.]
MGTDNGAGSLRLPAGAELVVAQGAILTVTGNNNTLDALSGGVIRNEGTIDLGANGLVRLHQGEVYNDSVIQTSTATDLELLLGLSSSPGKTGKIEYSGTTGSLAGTAVFVQKLYIKKAGTGSKLTLNESINAVTGASGTNIYIEEGCTLELAATVAAIGTMVENKGTIETKMTTTALSSLNPAVTSVSALTAIFASMDNKGRVLASGAITDLDAAFVIPANVELELSAASTFTTGPGGDLTIEGKLIIGSSTTGFSPNGDVHVKGTLEIAGSGVYASATGKSLVIYPTAKFEGAGVIKPATAGDLFIKESEGPSEPVYGIATTSGITGDDFSTAMSDVLGATELFEKKLEGELYGTDDHKWVGIVTATANNATDDYIVFSQTYGSDPNTYFKFPDGVDVSDAVNVFNRPAGVLPTNILDPSGITLQVDVNGLYLTLKDSKKTTGTSKGGTLEFTSVRFE